MSILYFIWKNKNIFLLAACVLLAVLSFEQTEKLIEAQKRNLEKLDYLKVQAQEIERYRNENNELVSRVSAFHASQETLKELYEAGRFEWLKSLEGIRKDLKNLQSATRIESVVRDSVSVVFRDTIIQNVPAKSFKYFDEYAKISGYATSENLHISYQIETPLRVAIYWKRKWFLGKKEYKAEAVSPNPNFIINQIEAVSVKKGK
jgi:hypothetical protein